MNPYDAYYIATPQTTEVDAQFHHSLTKTVFYDLVHDQRLFNAHDAGLNLLYASLGPQVALVRNMFVLQFLQQSHAEWLLFCDSDMSFAPDTPEQLLLAAQEHELCILGGYCMSAWQLNEAGPIKTAPTVFEWDDSIGDQRRLNHEEVQARRSSSPVLKVDATGTGFLLIRRCVFEDIAQQYAHLEVFTWFQDVEANGNPFSEDITFCMRAREVGYDTYVHTDLRIYHRKTIAV